MRSDQNEETSSLVAIERLIEEHHQKISTVEDDNVKVFFRKLKELVEENNTLIMKTVDELLELHFFVDEYQRGYKWKPRQVEELLNDISEFPLPAGDNFYCLQPVVVKYHPSDSIYKFTRWELIDGQQRMTTIYMILTYLKHSCWHIDYRTRKGSAKFLNENLSDTLKFKHWKDYIVNYPDFDNVDNYHFFDAYRTIDNWFTNPKNVDKKVEWVKKLLKHTKVIWYVAKGSDNLKDNHQLSIDIFMRLNSGKIQLTNAELIKALFLHNATGHENQEIFKLKQLEISREWDGIERALQDDAFWHFLNGPLSCQDVSTRIEYIFNLLIGKKESNLDEFYTFSSYDRNMKLSNDKISYVTEQWDEVKKCFYRLQEWYQDDNFYHRVGFLLTMKLSKARELWDASKGCGRIGFMTELNKLLSSKLREYFIEKDKFDLGRLRYGEHNKEIINVLILFNIYAHTQNKTRLPFAEYSKPTWSLEHIHAQNSQELTQEQELDAWFQETKSFVERSKNDLPEKEVVDLEAQLAKWGGDAPQKINFMKDVQDKLDEIVGEIDEDDMHGITNMALLAKDDNSSFNNAGFVVKRRRMLQIEKQGRFIPLATKNIFTKYYSKSFAQMYKWSPSDREGYEDAIRECLKCYIPEAELKKGDNQ